MSLRRAVVTGATGFLGRAVCHELLADGMSVVALAREPREGLPAEVGTIVCDLADRAAVTAAIDRTQPDFIYHLAGASSARRELAAVAETFAANLATAINVLTAVAHVGCERLILAGSLEEPDPSAAPSSPYAASKAAVSLYARMFHELYGVPVVSGRIFMTYGPAQRDLRKLVPHAILTLLNGEPLAVSSGRREVDWVYVSDVADGLAALARRPGIIGETIDLGTGRLTSVRALVEALVDLIQPATRPHFGALPDRPAEQVRRADVERSAALLGWRARVHLPEGLERTVRYYADNRHLFSARR